MLVLSRKPGERIILRNDQTGEEIDLTTVRIGPNSVRLGINAPRHWNIFRQELEGDALAVIGGAGSRPEDAAEAATA